MEAKETSPAEGELLANLEAHFANPAFTEAIHNWMSEFGQRVELVALDAEQPLLNMELFQSYAATVAGLLEGFIESQGTDGETLVDVLQRTQEAGVLSLTCLDFILASVDYECFLGLVGDFQAMQTWTEGSSATEPLPADDKMLS